MGVTDPGADASGTGLMVMACELLGELSHPVDVLYVVK
jgi:hypothetical protein